MPEETKTLVDRVKEYQNSPEADPWVAIQQLAIVMDSIINDLLIKPESEV